MGIRKMIYLTVGLICAAMMSQFPEFLQQYKQRMGGTLDELNRQVAALDARAAEQDMDRFQYIRKFLDNVDLAVQSEGQHLADMLGRQVRVREAIDALNGARPQMALVTLVLHLDPPTGQATLENYKPAVPLTMSGLLHALAGFVTGYLLIAFLAVFLPRKVARRSWS